MNPTNNPANPLSTSSKNKRKKQFYHQYKANLLSHAITNLSTHSLTNPEKGILQKGLGFIPTPKSFTPNLDKHNTMFIKRIYTDYFFRNSHKPRPIFHTSSDL